MPTALLVEDEPQARKYLRAVLERECPAFNVVGEAEDGAEGLALARSLEPDLVITDIRMAGMDGLELAMRLRGGTPAPYVVVVSGYQEFEYARSALKAGVVDYLLKPINPAQLRSVIGGMVDRIRADRYRERTALLSGLAAGTENPADTAKRRLPSSRYIAAVLRLGPPPSRFTPAEPSTASDLAGDLERLVPLDIWVLPGRDAGEFLFVSSGELTCRCDFERAVLSVAGTAPYRTLVFGDEAFPIDELGARLSTLQRETDGCIVPGHVRICHDPEKARPAGTPSATCGDAAFEARLEFLLSGARHGEFEQEVRALLAGWDRDQKPLVQAACRLRRILALVSRHASGSARSRDEELDAGLDEAIALAADYGELADRILGAVVRILQPPQHPGGDVSALFASITGYLEANFARPITLQSVCTAFGISQTYLSRLFRRYRGVTFNDCLTGIRIDAAKRLLTETPDMPLKDVAARAGYTDQFYFSRVFKAVTGTPPSVFAAASRSRTE